MSNDKKLKFEVPQTDSAVPQKDDKATSVIEVQGPPTTKDIIRELMQELMPAMMAMQAATMNASRPVDPRAERAAVAAGPKCPTCKQLEKACGKEHEAIVVYPVKYPEFGEWFRGVGINGVWYRSDNPGQLVPVPKCAVGDITQAVLTYEENERETRMGRTAQHNSGSVNNFQAVDAARAGWR